MRDARPVTASPGTCRAPAALAFAAAAALWLPGCAGTSELGPQSVAAIERPVGTAVPAPVRREEKVVKIGLILPFGALGQTAALAKSMKQAAEMALFDRQDLQFQILPYDDRGTADGARNAAEQAKADGAELVLGPLFAASVSSAASVTRAANIPLIAFSNDRQVAGRSVYLISGLPDEEVRRIVGYAIGQGKTRFAALIPDDAYGTVVDQAFRAAVAEGGGTMVAFERYPVAANGAVDPARRLVERMKEAAENGAAADVLFLPGTYDTIANLSPLLTYAGLEPGRIKVLGLSGLEGGGALGRDALLRGAAYAAPDPRGWQEFATRFSRAFGTVPPRIAALAFDAVTVAATLASEPAERRYTPASLARPSGFQGVDGTIVFNDSGIPRRALAVLEIGETTAGVVDPAPQSLSPGPVPAPALATVAVPPGRVN